MKCDNFSKAVLELIVIEGQVLVNNVVCFSPVGVFRRAGRVFVRQSPQQAARIAVARSVAASNSRGGNYVDGNTLPASRRDATTIAATAAAAAAGAAPHKAPHGPNQAPSTARIFADRSIHNRKQSVCTAIRVSSPTLLFANVQNTRGAEWT